MKAINFLFSVRNAQIFIFFLLFAASCHPPHGKMDEKSENVAVMADSLWTPTGNEKLDSLLRVASTDSEKINLLEQTISDSKLVRDFKTQTIYINMLDSLANKLKDPREKVEAWLKAGQFLRNISCYESAEKVLFKAQRASDVVKGEERMEMKANILLARGQNYVDMSDFASAAPLLTEAGNYFTQKNNYKQLIKIYNAQITPYFAQMVVPDSYEKTYYIERANYFLDKMAKLYSEVNDPVDKATCLNALINYEIHLKEYEKAKVLLARLDSLSRSSNNTDGLMVYYGTSGIVAEKQGNLVDGMKFQYKAYEIALEAGNMAKAAQGLANTAFDASQLGDYVLMRHYSLMGVELAEKYNIKSQWWRFLENLSLSEEKAGNYKQALDYRNKCVDIYLELYSENNANQINQYAARFESLQKELEIERQQHVIDKQNLQRGLLAGGVVVSAVILALLWYMLRLRNRRNHALTERNEALVEINATKDKFFSIISHDIKNPAIAQRDALKRLVKNASVWDAATLANYYDSLLESAEGEVELVYNLLGWAQLQTGRMVYTPATFNLAAGLRSDISLIRSFADKKDITLDVRIPEDADVTGDRNMISTAVRNLLSNAVKFTPAGGTVTLEASPHPSEGGEFSPPSGELVGACISITDTGIGMTEEQINSLFRLDSAHSRRGTAGEQGSGLGLIVCKELLEKHGSKLHVESEKGKGSRFWFTI